MNRFDLRGLYAITDSHLMPDDDTLLTKIEQALRGGARVVQYRDKSDDAERRLRQAAALQALCASYGVPLIINDDPSLARQSGAAGVHLGQQDGKIAAARDLLGNEAIIGVTCHDSLTLAHQAVAAGASYIAYGAFFPSKTKPLAIPAPLELLTRSKSVIPLPTVAIGGITVDNAAHAIAAGADSIAVIHALLATHDVEAQARRFSQLFTTDLIER